MKVKTEPIMPKIFADFKQQAQVHAAAHESFIWRNFLGQLTTPDCINFFNAQEQVASITAEKMHLISAAPNTQRTFFNLLPSVWAHIISRKSCDYLEQFRWECPAVNGFITTNSWVDKTGNIHLGPAHRIDTKNPLRKQFNKHKLAIRKQAEALQALGALIPYDRRTGYRSLAEELKLDGVFDLNHAFQWLIDNQQNPEFARVISSWVTNQYNRSLDPTMKTHLNGILKQCLIPWVLAQQPDSFSEVLQDENRSL